MVELMILGFLADGPLHGYELRRKMEQLHGYARTISDGTLYPAITRMIAAGQVRAEDEVGVRSGARRRLHVTDTGLARLRERLRTADGHDLSDLSHYIVVLAFLSHLPDEDERQAVLRRRLTFLEGAASFFVEGDEPVRSSDLDDPYRQAITSLARATRAADLRWLRGQLPADTGIDEGDRP
ncbi:PadR family transcriptional regulator [Aestuariimicrobium soli]|uniref:PadR family transcriptional regulator n=1 Tax=Aestuariimicrobium soli TaxID=2035834 RepID=UPI003EC0E2DE